MRTIANCRATRTVGFGLGAGACIPDRSYPCTRRHVVVAVPVRRLTSRASTTGARPGGVEGSVYGEWHETRRIPLEVDARRRHRRAAGRGRVLSPFADAR